MLLGGSISLFVVVVGCGFLLFGVLLVLFLVSWAVWVAVCVFGFIVRCWAIPQ